MAEAIYRAEGTLFPEASRSHLVVRLFLDRDYPALVAHFAYEPKLLEDRAQVAVLADEGRRRYGSSVRDDPPFLQNLLTLSFDDAQGFRGAAHRHPPDQSLVLGGKDPSPGLVPGPVPRGRLEITISVHEVVTPSCQYRLTLTPLEPDA